MSDAYKVPRILIEMLPEAERNASFHMLGLLTKLGSYILDFEAAVSLYEYASNVEKTRLAQVRAESDTVRRMALIQSFMSDSSKRWAQIALRDSTMTAYHFSYALKSITFEECPTLRRWVEHSKLRHARRRFDSIFPQAEEARNSVGHSAEMQSTPGKLKRNALSGSYKSENIIAEDVSHLSLSGVRDGSKLVSTWSGPHTHKSRAVFSECSPEALHGLYEVKALVCEAFQPAADESRRRLKEYQELRRVRSRLIYAIRSRIEL